MTAYVLRRIAQGLVVLWVVWTLVFVFYYVVPEDPARLLLGPRASAAAVARLRASLGLTLPVWQQYANFLLRIAHGNLGRSFGSGVPVTSMLAHDIPVDVALAVPAGLAWLALGVGVGLLATRRPRSRRARAASVFVLTGVATPTFVLSVLFVFVFDELLVGHGVRLFPPTGSWTPLHANPLAWAHDLVLPWITLALVTAAPYARLLTASLHEAVSEDYVRTARAKGISEWRLLLRHALRAALTPVASQFGIDLAAILGGAIVVEVVFGLPGLGLQLIGAVRSEDLPVVQGITVVISAFIIVANLIVDILYGVIDPRVRTAAGAGRRL